MACNHDYIMITFDYFSFNNNQKQVPIRAMKIFRRKKFGRKEDYLQTI